MTARSTPAITKALEYLETLRRNGARPGGRLPTVAQLARDAGVSPRAMNQAVRACAVKNILSVRHRAGICWLDSSIPVPVPLPAAATQVYAPRAEQLVDEIEKAVLNGALPDPLPPAKELRARYRVGHAAVGMALRTLAARGSLVRRGRRWVVVRSESQHGAGRIMLVAPSVDMADFATFGSKAADFCSILERQCAVNSSTLQFHSAFRPLAPAPSLIGYIIVATPQVEQTADSAARLGTSGRPVVIVDITGDTPLPHLTVTRQVSIARIQSARASARQVALRLRELGHRRVAFISPFNPGQTIWARDRLAGLHDVYGGDASAFCSTDTRSTTDIWEFVSSSLKNTLAPAARDFAASVHTHAGISDRSWLDVELPHVLVARYADSQALPLFEQAAADRTLTAWVCANDSCGVAALRYLSGRRINVPEEISVAGFDGSREGLLARLCSYDFNIPALIDTILGLIFGSKRHPPAPKPFLVDIPGLFLTRETIGRI